MGLSDIITTPFLLCLGICFLLVGLLGFYFMQKINEQNHKMNSMLDLITTVATELNHVNGRLHSAHTLGEPKVASNYQPTHSNGLIPVSDDDNEEEEEEEEDEKDEDEEEVEINSDDENDDDESENSDNKEKSFIKSISIGNVLNFNFEDVKLNETVVEELSEDDEDDIYSINTHSENEESDDQQDESNDESESSQVKTIQVSDLEEIKETVKIDYKKFALNKLRSMVAEKGLSDDASKLKKQELIKLLEDN